MSDTVSKVFNFDGGCNFRDMGGYAASDGRIIKPGQLYRSGVLAYFTEADQLKLAELNIRVICDLRRANEREEEPTLWPDNQTIRLDWDDDASLEKQGELPLDKADSVESARDIMKGVYRTMPNWLDNRLRGVFEYLLSGQVPLLFHCAAGKDRTGLTAALILHSLGVDRSTILADYAQTNEAVDIIAFVVKHQNAKMGLATEDHPAMQIPVDIRQALAKADPIYLNTALQQIEADYQSIDNYLLERFAITAELRDELRNTLLMSR